MHYHWDLRSAKHKKRGAQALTHALRWAYNSPSPIHSRPPTGNHALRWAYIPHPPFHSTQATMRNQAKESSGHLLTGRSQAWSQGRSISR